MAWVIVVPDEKIMIFEQGIKWVGGWMNEKWLHDSGLLEHVDLACQVLNIV
ncbi:hypothetical protein [Lysinibacillus sp. Ag94]|uniref:hypothetical protein n=1 Tax=Lysinibacillus sp. Ag94 TaxID=2936682 RepID=UPI00200D0E99|nr:hypothetical protein [Lysinibacillus sp. Ag94]UPW81395.1 hypothetical protein MY533_11520 [Lysinibacillus sp. Ag94]